VKNRIFRPGHEGIRQPRRLHFYLDVAGERGLADIADYAEIDDAIIAETRGPVRKRSLDCGEHGAAALQLDAVALAIIEAHGLHVLEARQRPGETGRGILAAGKQYQRPIAHDGTPSLG